MTISRKIAIATTALLLAACGGAEEYEISVGEAASMLAGMAHSPAIAPMPAMLREVNVAFETLPGGRSVQWIFYLKGNELGKIVATVEPDGDSASMLNLDYVDGAAPVSRLNSDVRSQLSGNLRQLLLEAVDSSLERRPFNMALREQIEANITSAMVGSAFQGVSDKLDAEIAAGKWDSDAAPASDAPQPDPKDATQPATDLSRFNN